MYQLATLYHYAKKQKNEQNKGEEKEKREENEIEKDFYAIYPKHNGEIQEIRPHGGHYTPKLKDVPFFIEEVFPNVNWKSECEDINDIVMPSYIFGINEFWESIDEMKSSFLKPNDKIIDYIQTKYKDIYSTRTLGIHLRYYYASDSFYPEDNVYEWIMHIITNSLDKFDSIVIVSNYLTKATEFSNTFLNNIDKKIYLIENEPNFVDFFMLSMCDTIICSNSTFSFWAAALSNSKDIYMCPEYKPANVRNSIPPEWKQCSDVFYKYSNSK